jgi:hypothetical protein
MVQEGQVRKKYPSDLTDEPWAIVEPLIPPAKQSPRGGRPRKVNMREVLGSACRARPRGAKSSRRASPRLCGRSSRSACAPASAAKRWRRGGGSRGPPCEPAMAQASVPPHRFLGRRVESGPTHMAPARLPSRWGGPRSSTPLGATCCPCGPRPWCHTRARRTTRVSARRPNAGSASGVRPPRTAS